MTVAVLTTTTTATTTHREPLRVVDMATSQARPASSSAHGNGETRRGRRTSGRGESKENGGDENTAPQKSTRSAAKRNAAVYDEDDEGFKFTRAAATKKPKIGSENAPENDSAVDQVSKPKSTRGRPPKKQTGKAQSQSVEEDVSVNTANGRLSRGRRGKTSPEPEVQSGKRPGGKRKDPPQSTQKTPKKGRPSLSKTTGTDSQSPETTHDGTTKIALPMADTPVIRRNKEMRQERSGREQRRSSLGMRGRRASSLIDSGASNAIPHKEVSTAEFYKHIASDGPSEPRRMKQLLTWCATRAMEQKPSQSSSVDDDARRAARFIQEQLIEDITNKSELSDWFARDDAPTPTVIVKKPNPKNIQNAEKLKELESQITRLQNEKQALKALLRPPSIPKLEAPSPQGNSEYFSSSHTSLPIDTATLDPQQKSIITTIGLETLQRNKNNKVDKKTLQPTVTNPPLPPATVSNRLSHITSSLAPTLDAFASGLHDIDIYRSSADRLSSEILRICSQRLEERDIRNAAQTREIEGDVDQDDGGGGEENTKDSSRPRQTRRQREDVGVILGALSRVERR
ncbi:Mis12-Mtw1 protein family-domain-containing protein [Talaromyces proteolyticus]|uniref:Mis12-Mtw1 protein family-domain-containing protein n=1 Tax=Talaromyces proteolyticus TaxID=1131652 RepID=A0AAD4PYV1_9EURO|nr:Mis12-Mtw1 protein family-domain-containing protein [Talaromyces proteolyticus]KAH8695009.1 Mis12-Mtw1 protein family-domain-containing protein [Talaromyces proteolyticus]